MTRRRIVSRSRAARGFTLVELLVVLGIMLLILAVAIPSLKALTGTRSYEVATNKITAYLSRARLIAIGQVQETGVMFYLDPQTQQVAMTLVYTVPSTQVGDGTGKSPGGQGPQDTTHYLNMVPNTGSEFLPSGVGFQTINAAYNPGTSASTVSQYNYFPSQNQTSGATTLAGDVILFDAYGHSVTVPYGFCYQMTNTANTPVTTDLYNLLFYKPGQTTSAPSSATWSSGSPALTYTTIGFVYYDPNAYGTQSSNVPGNSSQDNWLNGNSQLNMVNRNTGTVIQSQ